MIILTKQHNDGTTSKEGINIQNLIGANTSKENETWIRYWDGAEVRRMVVTDTIEEVAQKMAAARGNM